MERPRRNVNELVSRWLPVVAWAALVVLAGPLFGAALAGRSVPVRTVASVGLWAGWACGLAFAVIPSVRSLTGLRLLGPMAPLAALAAAVAGGASAVVAIVGVAATAVAAVLGATGDLGGHFAQASAYGDEARFLLRPPGALLLGPLPVLWLGAAIPCLAGPLLLAAQQWPAGIVVTAAGVAAAVLVAGRAHALARRWLVFVPAGVVVHDQLGLAETVMLRRDDVLACGLAPATTEAADLTIGAMGMAVELRLAGNGVEVVLNTPSRRDRRATRALHVRSFLVSPTRPGAVLAEARRRGIPGFG